MLERNALAARFPANDDSPPVGWRITDGLTSYEDAVAFMDSRVNAIAAGREDELVWLVEHPPLYSAGTSAVNTDLIDPHRFPVHKTGRGGEYTYHGPGQRVAYVMLDLNRRKRDVRAFVAALEALVISTLETMNIRGERREDRVGVWVQRPDKARMPDGTIAEDKIAAIGVRLRKWVSFHGISINVEPDLSHYDGIIACGIKDHGVTSLADLGQLVPLHEVDIRLRACFEDIFGPVRIER